MVYRKVAQPDHRRADILGLVPVHILVMEQAIGRSLEKDEITHHCDFDKLNNAISNLLLLTRKEHQQLPKWQAKFIIEKGLYNEFLDYWKMMKDMVDPLEELEQKLVRAENDSERLKVKVERQEQ